jgi:hypothetical protein
VSSILKQVEERIGVLEQKYGRRRRPLTPFSPMPRDDRLRRDVFKKLNLPVPVHAWFTFEREGGSFAALLTWRTSKVIDALLFEGVPGIRDSLLDLAANALILADCIEELSRPHQGSPPSSIPPRRSPR